MAGAPESWLRHPFALVHGEDGDARRAAVQAWTQRHVDPEWADFCLTVCSENCPWAEVQNAVMESAPMGAVRVVVVPQAENLLDKPKELPASIKGILTSPPEGVALLLVSRVTLSAASGRTLGAKPFNDWAKEGRVFKTGALDPSEATDFIEDAASRLGMTLDQGAAALLLERIGSHPGTLRRAVEVLDLAREGARVDRHLVDVLTFRMDEPRAFAWSEAWQKGTLDQAIDALKQALDEDPSGAAVGMVAQAARDVGRIVVMAQALAEGVTAEDELARRAQMPPNQKFLVGRSYLPVARKVGLAGAKRLLGLVAAIDRDVKGVALSGSATPLAILTFELWRAWRR